MHTSRSFQATFYLKSLIGPVHSVSRGYYAHKITKSLGLTCSKFWPLASTSVGHAFLSEKSFWSPRRQRRVSDLNIARVLHTDRRSTVPETSWKAGESLWTIARIVRLGNISQSRDHALAAKLMTTWPEIRRPRIFHFIGIVYVCRCWINDVEPFREQVHWAPARFVIFLWFWRVTKVESGTLGSSSSSWPKQGLVGRPVANEPELCCNNCLACSCFVSDWITPSINSNLRFATAWASINSSFAAWNLPICFVTPWKARLVIVSICLIPPCTEIPSSETPVSKFRTSDCVSAVCSTRAVTSVLTADVKDANSDIMEVRRVLVDWHWSRLRNGNIPRQGRRKSILGISLREQSTKSNWRYSSWGTKLEARKHRVLAPWSGRHQEYCQCSSYTQGQRAESWHPQYVLWPHLLLLSRITTARTDSILSQQWRQCTPGSGSYWCWVWNDHGYMVSYFWDSTLSDWIAGHLTTV